MNLPFGEHAQLCLVRVVANHHRNDGVALYCLALEPEVVRNN